MNDDEKIGYIVIGIFIGIGVGFLCGLVIHDMIAIRNF
jgi:TctA family transporter|tara:strand:+ start:5560 stop:5673 length:114 start_codon:yes stop_codon:yes gene_type:complete